MSRLRISILKMKVLPFFCLLLLLTPVVYAETMNQGNSTILDIAGHTVDNVVLGEQNVRSHSVSLGAFIIVVFTLIPMFGLIGLFFIVLFLIAKIFLDLVKGKGS